jgi:hypothetical protein
LTGVVPQAGIHHQYFDLVDSLLNKGDKPKNVRCAVVIYAKEHNPGGNWLDNIPTLKQVATFTKPGIAP